MSHTPIRTLGQIDKSAMGQLTDPFWNNGSIKTFLYVQTFFIDKYMETFLLYSTLFTYQLHILQHI